MLPGQPAQMPHPAVGHRTSSSPFPAAKVEALSHRMTVTEHRASRKVQCGQRAGPSQSDWCSYRRGRDISEHPLSLRMHRPPKNTARERPSSLETWLTGNQHRGRLDLELPASQAESTLGASYQILTDCQLPSRSSVTSLKLARGLGAARFGKRMQGKIFAIQG